MQLNLIAAAGIAEAAWMMTMLQMGSGMLVICCVTFLALAMRSRILAITAVVLLALFSHFFQPWHCFAPFEADAYDDPDVVSAANDFRFIGFSWIATSILVATATFNSWRGRIRSPFADRDFSSS